jgi:hypothetical protein
MDTEYTKGFKAGSVFEMERIIKLLEPLNFHTAEKLAISIKEEYGIDYKYSDLAIVPLIELIKGETNV